MASSPSPALAPPPGNPRFPLLDAMRGIAAGMIVVAHSAGVSGFAQDNALGLYISRFNMGVTLFFLLSGFLLYRPFVAARLDGRPPIRIRDFARRRLLRIVPAYWVALTLLALWPGLVGLWEGDWWQYYAFLQIYSSDTSLAGIPPAWSLCVEISFYLALPFIAAGLARLSRGASREAMIRRDLIALVVLGVASVVFRSVVHEWALDSGSFTALTLLNTLPTFFDWFAIGMALAVLSVAWHGREQSVGVARVIADRPWVPWALFLVVLWVVSTQLGLPRGTFTSYGTRAALGEHVLYALCALLLLLPAIFGDWRGGWPRRMLALRPMAWFGLVSYGVFLYHAPLLLWLHQQDAKSWLPGSEWLSLTIVAFAVATTAAALSYYLVERPLLRFKDSGSSRASRARAAEASDPDASAATAFQAPALSGSSSAASRASSSA